MNKIEKIISFANTINDNREQRKITYPLGEILLASFVGILAGCNGWDDIEDLCKSKLSVLRKILLFENGIAGHDTIRRMINLIDPKQFQAFFTDWVKFCFGKNLSDKIYAIDGKQAKGSKFANNPAVHMLNVFATNAGISISQCDVDKKSNEIVAFHEVLQLLDLKGAVITVDALNCQKKAAKTIDEEQGKYLFAVKRNHGCLYNQIIQQFSHNVITNPELQYFETNEKGHGRIETRKCTTIHNLHNIKDSSSWSGLASIIKVEFNRTNKGETSNEVRYYISNIENISAETAAKFVRGHWSVENNLHWLLDVAFCEDDCRVVGNAAKNLAVIRQMARNCIVINKNPKYSIPRTMRNLSFSEEFLDNFIHRLMC